MQSWKNYRKKLLQDPEVRKEYYRLAPRYKVISEIIGARIRKKMTQKELAEKMGTKQSAIARLESGNSNPSIDFLEKIAKATDSKLSIRFTR